MKTFMEDTKNEEYSISDFRLFKFIGFTKLDNGKINISEDFSCLYSKEYTKDELISGFKEIINKLDKI